jgi:formylglycine-generating enzyme required for sulfatase activity
MLPVPPGKFIFGSTIQKDENDLQARETVIKKPFWISEKEISQNQYEEIMWNNPSIFRGDSSMLPVEKVSWKNAVNFCQRLTDKEKRSGRLPEGYIYRLPYEKEWEYCARANVSGRYFFGNDIRHLPAFAWYRGNSLRRTHPGGTRKPNAWGLYDILGNVSEWCISSNTHGYYVLRGGSWGTINSGVRCSSRVKTDSPDFSDNTTGFRIVLAPENISG